MASSKLFHINYDFQQQPSPFIAIDPISGRHFIYNNDDKILIFSHNPIYNRYNDKSKPLIEISLDDKMEDIDNNNTKKTKNPRIDPTLHIINDNKGNSALLVIGGHTLENNN